MTIATRLTLLALASAIALGGCDVSGDDDVGDDDTAAVDDDSADDDTGAADDDSADDDDTEPPPYNACGIGRGSPRVGGGWDDPIEAPFLPFVDHHDTSTSSVDLADAYDCAPDVDERGPEIVYRFEAAAPGTLRAEVVCTEPVDVDLHLLQDPTIVDGVAQGCIARGHTGLEVTDLPAGTYVLVADSWADDGGEYDGPYDLAFEWIAEDVWSEVTVAEGITWSRLRSADLQGGDQTINVLRIDPEAGWDLQPASHGGCRTVADVAGEIGALAGINAGFFDGSCASLDFLKADGTLLAVNAVTGAAQRTLGWTAGSPLQLAWIDAGADWPEVSDGVGGYPNLVTGGTVDVDPAGDSSFFTSRHPRTAMGLTAAGELLLVTADGRTSAGDGLTTDQMAQLMIDLGCVDAVNLDGGGSTTMVVDDCWVNGVVNHPSDNGAGDHDGSRAVADGLYVR